MSQITLYGNYVRAIGSGFSNQGLSRLVCIIEGGEIQRISRVEVVNDTLIYCALHFYSQ